MDFVPGTNYKILQSETVFKYSVDSIFLSAFAKPKGKVLDLGCGTGIFMFRALDNRKVDSVTGVEINMEACELLRESCRINEIEKTVEVFCQDIVDFAKEHPAGSYDTIFCNPPYYQGSLEKEVEALAIAKHEKIRTLEDFVAVMAKLLKIQGKGYFVLSAPRMVDLLEYCRKYELEPKRIQFLAKKPSKPPFVVAVEVSKRGGKFLQFLPQLHLYDENRVPLDYENIYLR